MQLTVTDLTYLRANGDWVPAIQYNLFLGDKVEVKPYFWGSKTFKTKKEASDYASKAGTIFARKLGLIN